MNLKSGRIEGFEGYSQFNSVKEFNTHVEMWLAVKKQEFSKGELVGLKRLVRFSVKVPGVSNAKIGTLLKAINEDYQGNGISRSTFKRMIIKAKELGILTIHETERLKLYKLLDCAPFFRSVSWMVRIPNSLALMVIRLNVEREMPFP